MERISDNLSKLCKELDIDVSDEESGENQYEIICEDIENVTVRSIMPIVAAAKRTSGNFSKTYSPTISNLEEGAIFEETHNDFSDENNSESRPSPLRKVLCQNLNKVGP